MPAGLVRSNAPIRAGVLRRKGGLPKRSTESLLLVRVARALDAASIPYMLIGGQAVAYFGEPRFTRDIDITLGVSPDRFQDVAAIARKLKLTPAEKKIPAEKLAQDSLLFPVFDGGTGMRVDFVFTILEYEKQAIKRARSITIDGYKIRVASPEDLIVMKAIAGRPQDLGDIRGLCIHNPRLNLEYIRYWLKLYTEMIAEPVLNCFETIFNELNRKRSRK